VHDAGIDIELALDAGCRDNRLQMRLKRLCQYIETRPVGMTDTGNLVTNLHTWRQCVAAPVESFFGGGQGFPPLVARRLRAPLHMTEVLFDQRRHVLQRDAADKDQCRVVGHEVSLVQLALIASCVLLEIIGVAFGHVDHRGPADQRIHCLAVFRFRSVQVAEPLLDQDHAFRIKVAEYGILHAVRLNPQE